jgi:hypothetical protein
MGVVDGYSPSTLQFVADALRSVHAVPPDLTTAAGRILLNSERDFSPKSGHRAIRNPDGTTLTLAQIATAANLTVAQVTDIAGRL